MSSGDEEESEEEKPVEVSRWIRSILDDDNDMEDGKMILGALHAMDPSLEMSDMKAGLELHLDEIKAETLEVMASRYGEFAKVAEVVTSSMMVSEETRLSLSELRTGVAETRDAYRRKKIALTQQLEAQRSLRKREREVKAVEHFSLLLTELETGLKRENPAVERLAHATLSLRAQLAAAVEFVSDGELLTQVHELAGPVEEAEMKTRRAVENAFERSTFENKNKLLLEASLRSAAALGCGARLETIFSDRVMRPFLEATFTTPRLDGAMRNSRSGLPSIYAATLDYVKDRAGPAIRACDNVLGGPMKVLAVDLLVKAVWEPIVEAMESRLKSLFDLGSAKQVHKTVRATFLFMDQLAETFFPENEDQEEDDFVVVSSKKPESCEAARDRLEASDATQRLLQTFNLPVYFELVKVDILASVFSSEEKNPTRGPSSLALGVVDATRKLWDPTEWFLRPIADEDLSFTFELLKKFFEELQKRDLSSVDLCASSAVDAAFVAKSLKAHLLGGEGIFKALVLTNKDSLKVALDAALQEAADLPSSEIAAKATESLADVLAEEVIKGLRLVKSVTARYHLTNAPDPNEASDYLKTHAFKPLDDYDENWRSFLVVDEAFYRRHNDKIHEAYAAQVQAVLDHAKKFHATLQKRRDAKKIRGGQSSIDLAGDALKVAKQLLLDVDATIERLDTFSSLTHSASPLRQIQTALRSEVDAHQRPSESQERPDDHNPETNDTA